MPSSSRKVSGRPSPGPVARRPPAGPVARNGPPIPLERAAHAMHGRSAALQAGAGAAGAATNRVLAATAAPLARAPEGSYRRRVHNAGKQAAWSAAGAVTDATNGARRATHSAAAAATRAAGDSPEARGLGSMAVAAFEVAAAAPVFVHQVLAAGHQISHGKPPKITKPLLQQALVVGHMVVGGKPNKPPKPSKPNKPNKPGKFSHHWVNGEWVPIKPAVDAYGKPYKPPPGYPVAKSLTVRRGANAKTKTKSQSRK